VAADTTGICAMAKLPVWPTVKAAYAAVWTHRWRLLRFAVVPFALMAAIDAGERLVAAVGNG